MIRNTKLLNDTDWSNLHGNTLYVTMLRNKVSCDCNTTKNDEGITPDISEYLQTMTEDLVYYKSENVFGWIKYEIYFESPVDKENFIAFFNTVSGLEKVKK